MKILGHLAKGLGEGKKSNEEAHWLRQERLKSRESKSKLVLMEVLTKQFQEAGKGFCQMIYQFLR